MYTFTKDVKMHLGFRGNGMALNSSVFLFFFFYSYLDLNLYSVTQWGLRLVLYPGYVWPFYFIVFGRSATEKLPCRFQRSSLAGLLSGFIVRGKHHALVGHNVSREYRFISDFCQLTRLQSVSQWATLTGLYPCDSFASRLTLMLWRLFLHQRTNSTVTLCQYSDPFFSIYRSNVSFSATDGAPFSGPCFCPIFQIFQFQLHRCPTSQSVTWVARSGLTKWRISPLLVSAGISSILNNVDNLSTHSFPIFWVNAAVLVKSESFVMLGWSFISPRRIGSLLSPGAIDCQYFKNEDSKPNYIKRVLCAASFSSNGVEKCWLLHQCFFLRIC